MSDDAMSERKRPTRDYGFDFGHAILTVEGSQVANHLLRELMDALGVPIVAEGASPREVWLRMLDAVVLPRRDDGV